MENIVIIVEYQKMNFSKYGQALYGGFKRGQRLEIDRKINSLGYEIQNCVWLVQSATWLRAINFHMTSLKKWVKL